MKAPVRDWKPYFMIKALDVDLLMIVAALGAAGCGLWRREYYLIIDGAVLLILIFAISGVLESYAMQRTARDIRGLMSLTSDTARVILNGQEQIVAIAQLKIGDQVLVKLAEMFAIDSLIIEGYSTLHYICAIFHCFTINCQFFEQHHNALGCDSA